MGDAHLCLGNVCLDRSHASTTQKCSDWLLIKRAESSRRGRS
jgi:hypothetical protein